MEITLRIHHVICMQSFIGKGYSEKFVSNFDSILQYIQINHNKKVISLVNYCDDICKYCPNKLNNNKCINEEFINNLDYSYKIICNFDYSAKYSLDEINNIIKNTLTINKFKETCNKCKWYGICSRLIKNIINKK